MTYKCNECGKTSESRRGMAIHCAHAHDNKDCYQELSPDNKFDSMVLKNPEFENFCDDLFGSLNGRIIHDFSFKQVGNLVFLSLVYEIND